MPTPTTVATSLLVIPCLVHNSMVEHTVFEPLEYKSHLKNDKHIQWSKVHDPDFMLAHCIRQVAHDPWRQRGEAVGVMTGDYYNRHISAWEPVLEPWKYDISNHVSCILLTCAITLRNLYRDSQNAQQSIECTQICVCSLCVCVCVCVCVHVWSHVSVQNEAGVGEGPEVQH